MKKRLLVAFGIMLMQILNLDSAVADQPGKERFPERIPLPEAAESGQPADGTRSATLGSVDWTFSVSPVVTMMFFDDDRNRPLYGGYVEARRSDFPVNLRIGIEGAHFDSENDALVDAFAASGSGASGPELTFIRVPIALEYYREVMDNLTLFAGPGLDIIHMDNFADDTGVGLHLSGRAAYEVIQDLVDVTLEGGYLFADDLESDGGDVNFDGAFVSAGVAVKF